MVGGRSRSFGHLLPGEFQITGVRSRLFGHRLSGEFQKKMSGVGRTHTIHKGLKGDCASFFVSRPICIRAVLPGRQPVLASPKF